MKKLRLKKNFEVGKADEGTHEARVWEEFKRSLREGSLDYVEELSVYFVTKPKDFEPGGKLSEAFGGGLASFASAIVGLEGMWGSFGVCSEYDGVKYAVAVNPYYESASVVFVPAEGDWLDWETKAAFRWLSISPASLTVAFGEEHLEKMMKKDLDEGWKPLAAAVGVRYSSDWRDLSVKVEEKDGWPLAAEAEFILSDGEGSTRGFTLHVGLEEKVSVKELLDFVRANFPTEEPPLVFGTEHVYDSATYTGDEEREYEPDEE